ncbi:hypothetical protein DICPUDRAFT_154535 [Dictyostelium purpureum]|uniref:palmitoyl-protein hydrolase n=1 Tax=Dictyostelium purpureum TaxID=5786 RepID=F0ZRL1_DICPU|nr:uncharacterized protein DICPUDRAFT_154535 [Dictyostelium purpureum]EGC33438.1 hypothetical protein DICPUDRAFT_154535 [Dictyostelium purpureum]|eukprot:XP_003290057.1 hypothetical protein DICPUDRAFT_154535 [Dictyostelium purpureum]
MRFLAVFLILLSVASIISAYRPVVLMHGVTTGSSAMNNLEKWIQEALPGIYVKNVEIGNGKLDSIFMDMNQQVEEFKNVVQSDPNLANGFNVIGFSQGTLISRAFIERFNEPKVNNYIGWNGPQAGQFGTPFVNIQWVDKLLTTLTYSDHVQDNIAPAEYWKNPFKIPEYLEKSIFLADINNEGEAKNQTYKDNISSLSNMILSYSINDKTIVPKESGWFGFYADGNTDNIVPLQQQDQYTQDWLGLRTLDESGRLHFFTTDCTHKDHPIEDYCKIYFTNYTLPWLQN